MRVLIIDVSSVALTLKTAGSVHATTVGAHSWHQSALVDLFRVIRNWIHYLTGNHAAEDLVFAWKLIVFI